MSEHRQTALIVVPALKVWGGAEAVTVWMLEALRGDYDLTVLTWETADTRELNRVYGTSLQATDFRVRRPPPLFRRAVDRLVQSYPRHAFQKVCVLCRIAQGMRNDFDVLISAQHEMDFGRRAIQYVHSPSFRAAYEPERRLEAEGRGLTAVERWRLDLQCRGRPWRMLSRFRFERMKRNLTLVNSNWTREAVRELYQIESVMISPPVVGDFPDVPWDQRREHFVCIGRFAPLKRIEMVIEILATVRARGREVHLRLIGLREDRATGRAYFETVERLVRRHASWVTLVERVDRDELIRTVSESRYGIHAAEAEPFGLAVAEMVRAGCIVFTGDSGGQAEIVGSNERLLFHGVEDGVAKILTVLRQPRLQVALRQQLADQGVLSTAGEFASSFRDAVRWFSEAEKRQREDRKTSTE